MKVNYVTRPIDVWPGERTPEHRRERSRFDTPFSKTMDLLEREIGYLLEPGIGYVEVIIGLDIEESDIRIDGKPRANARPRTPGVIISFPSKHGPLKYACDRFYKGWRGSVEDWQENLRAIALGLEALRKVERYGITRRGEQYAGFRALPGSVEPTMTTRAAAEALLNWSELRDVTIDGIMGDHDAFKRAYRVAAAAVHPDRTNGSAHKFHVVQECRKILEAHHGRS